MTEEKRTLVVESSSKIVVERTIQVSAEREPGCCPGRGERLQEGGANNPRSQQSGRSEETHTALNPSRERMETSGGAKPRTRERDAFQRDERRCGKKREFPTWKL